MKIYLLASDAGFEDLFAPLRPARNSKYLNSSSIYLLLYVCPLDARFLVHKMMVFI